MDLVSIITPTYNSEDFILETYQSIVKQTYTNWEWVVTDDFSSDKTWHILQKLKANDPRLKVFRNFENLGAGFSRNNSIKHAKGKFIAFLDADDLWLPSKLSLQIGFMNENDYLFTYTKYQKFSAQSELSIISPPEKVTYEGLLYGNVIGCLTAVYNCEALGKRYMPLIRKRQDMGLWLDILSDVPSAHCLNRVLAKYRVDSGMTSNKTTVLGYQWRFYREVVGLNFLKACFVFGVYAVRGFIKHIS